MKNIVALLAICFVIIIGTIVYLIGTGVSIRTAPIIKPSFVGLNFHNVSQGLFLRLFPDFQQSEYVLWGADQKSSEFKTILHDLQKRYEQQFKTSVHILEISPDFNQNSLADCAKPCWILLPIHQAHELVRNNWIEDKRNFLNNNYVTITWVQFDRNNSVPPACIAEKRLDFECLKSVSVQEVERKLVDKSQRYFFMRKYKDRDYFLFVEGPHSIQK